jgi:hypothetical protein
MESVVYAFESPKHLICTDLIQCGNVVFFTHQTPFKKVKQKYKELNNLTIVCIRYKLNIVYNFTWLKQKIKTNYIYEPELSLALIWFYKNIKTYFYPTHCEVFVTDITSVNDYYKELVRLLS